MRHTFAFGSFQTTVSIVPFGALYDSVDEGVYAIADRNSERYLPAFGTHHVLPSGETSKSWHELERMLASMLTADLTRASSVLGVGGGVVTDLSSFAASIYMRGCRLVLAPTTLLAMVDAAIGGKTGINFGGYKNIVGTFYPAHEVRIAPETLATLPDREYLSGLAEVIKTGMLGSERLLELLETERERILARDPELLSEVVWECVRVKGEIVETDLTESGVRATLNLGHTFAHALESVKGLGVWSHGEAVAWGLAQALELGHRAELTDAVYMARCRAILERYGYRLAAMPDATEAICNAMRKDKKRSGNAIRFVLQRSAGSTLLTDVDMDEVRAVLNG